MSFKKIILFSVLITVIVVVLIVIANNWRNKTFVNKITIKGNLTITESEILSTAGLKADSLINLDELNIAFIRDRIAKHPEIKRVVVSKEPPSELIIEIIEKKPIALLVKNTELNLIDEDKEVFSIMNFEKVFDLPVINGLVNEGSPEYKSDLDVAIFFIKSAYAKGKYIQNQISEVNMSDSGRVTVFSNDRPTVFYFPKVKKESEANEVYKAKLGVFKKFIDDEMVKNNLRCEYVDLRFSNQVIAKLN
ncbi:MAG: FtsQ-type POTRA domain-containing protein [Ignavibacteria bacterium]|nr:FtsQ-type POTRA domain-containing protein [Ignavibacteria bacterium]